MFSHTLLLAEGRVIYAGATSAMLGHFRENGRDCPGGVNPADHALHVLKTEGRASLHALADQAAAADDDRERHLTLRELKVRKSVCHGVIDTPTSFLPLYTTGLVAVPCL